MERQILTQSGLLKAGGGEPFAPRVDRLLAHLAPLGDQRGLVAIVRLDIAALRRSRERLTTDDRRPLVIGKP
jgi:hypothetical protein